jgi:hypothetical protein
VTREEVIKSLETAVKNFERYSGDEYGREYDYARVEVDVLEDAIALLKAQEPRVLGLDEFHRGMAVWLEYVDKEDVVLVIGGSSCGGAKCFITEYDLGVSALDSEYGIRWMAWTAKPTIKMRKAVKWDG